VQLLNFALIAALFSAMAALSGCSGGSGGTAASAAPVTVAKQTGGLLKLGISGTSANIAGMDLQVTLPAGVTVAADPVTGEAASGVVTASGAAAGGNNSLVMAKYAPAATGTPAMLHIVVISAAGLLPGEFVTIRFDLAAGASLPAKEAFSTASISAKGFDGSTLSGITVAPLSVEATGNKQAQLIVTGTPVTVVPVFLNISVATPTRISSQTISGALTKVGDTLTISTNTAATVTAPAITGGTWSALVSGLVEGANTISVTEKGGGGAAVATVSATIVLDTTPPFINIDTIIGHGDVGRGVAGTAEVGSTIMVKCDHNLADVIFFDDLIQNITRWSGMIIGNLPQGSSSCTVTATDAAGNQTVKVVQFSVDTIPPSLSFSMSNMFSTSSASQTISGTVEAGVTPSISVNGTPFTGAVTVNGTAWSAQLTGLTAGPNIVTATATDAAGNVTTQTTTVTGVTANGSFSGAAAPTIADALKAMRIAVGLATPTTEDLLRGDLYADNKIDLSDAILILKKTIGLTDVAPAGSPATPQLL
jgi:hypothetical protein